MEALLQGIAAARIHAPVTVATNLALALQCGVLAHRLGASRSRLGRLWTGFFGWMAVATAVGAVKHGLGASDAPRAYTTALVVSNLASGIAVHRGQLATAAAHAPPVARATLSTLASLQLACFATWTWLVPSAAAAVVNAALGLLPVVAAESRAAGPGDVAARTLVGGFGLASAAALVYGAGDRLPGPLEATDAAHLVMIGAFALLGVGAHARVAAPTVRLEIDAPTGGTS